MKRTYTGRKYCRRHVSLVQFLEPDIISFYSIGYAPMKRYGIYSVWFWSLSEENTPVYYKAQVRVINVQITDMGERYVGLVINLREWFGRL